MRDRQHWPKPGTVQTGPVNTSSCNSLTPHHMNISDLGQMSQICQNLSDYMVVVCGELKNNKTYHQ